MRLRSGRAAALVVPLAILAALWAQPTTAFAFASLQPRAAQAAIVDNASAYIVMSQPACSGQVNQNTSCTFTITNRGATPLTLTAIKVSDPDAVVNYYWNGTAPTAVGSSASLTLWVRACFSGCATTYHALFDIYGANPGVENALITHYEYAVKE